MSLKKLRDDLLKRDSTSAKRGHSITSYHEWQKNAHQDTRNDAWAQKSDPTAKLRMTVTLWAAFIVAVVFIVFVLIYLIVQYNRSYYLDQNVTLSISSQTETPSNRSIEVIFDYYNDNRAPLENAKIHIQFDEYFVPETTAEFQQLDQSSGIISIGTIAPRQSASVRLVGQFVAPQNEVEVIAGTLSYNVSGQQVQKEKKENFSITITTSPLVLDLSAAREVASGNEIELRANYRNTGEVEIDDIGVSVDFPDGFVFRDALPASDDNGTWTVGSLAPGSQGEIIIRGTLSGNPGNSRTFQAQLIRASGGESLRYTSDDHNFTIIDPPIKILQSIVGRKEYVVRAGEDIKYSVRFQNTTGIPLRNIILRTLIDGDDNVEYTSISASDNGFFDISTKSIEWKAVNVPELQNLSPGESGVVEFSVKLKNIIPIDSPDDKNITVSTIAVADSPDFPDLIKQNKDVLSNTLVTKLETKLLLGISTQVIDGTYPLEPGKSTTVRVTLEAGSVSNAVGDAKIRGFIGPGVKFLSSDQQNSQSSNADGNQELKLDDRANAFQWDIGDISNGVGVLTPSKTTTFDVEITPAVNVSLDASNLLQDVDFTAQDLFTQQQVTADVEKITASSAKE